MNTILQTCVQDSSWRENKGRHEKSSLSGVHYDNRIEDVKPKKTWDNASYKCLSPLRSDNTQEGQCGLFFNSQHVTYTSLFEILGKELPIYQLWGGGVKMSWLPASCWLLLRINVGRKQQQPRHSDLSNVNVLYWWMLTLWALSDVEPSCKALSLHHLHWQNLDSLSIHNSKLAARP